MDRMKPLRWGLSSSATDGNISLSIEPWHRNNPAARPAACLFQAYHERLFARVGRRPRSKSAANHHPASGDQGLDADGLVSLEA